MSIEGCVLSSNLILIDIRWKENSKIYYCTWSRANSFFSRGTVPEVSLHSSGKKKLTRYEAGQKPSGVTKVQYSDYRDVNKKSAAPELLPLARKWKESINTAVTHSCVHRHSIHRSCHSQLISLVRVLKTMAEWCAACNFPRRARLEQNWPDIISMVMWRNRIQI